MIYKFPIIFFFTFSTLFLHGQDLKMSAIDSLSIAIKYDFFNHNYNHLNKDFKIIINSNDFQKIKKKHNFYERTEKGYVDSLQVILMGEFKNNHFSRIGTLRLSYTWERLKFHCREDIEVLKTISNKYNVQHPYRFKEILIKNNIEQPDVQQIINNLKVKLIKEYGSEKIIVLSNDELLTFSFNNNPDVHQLKKEIFDRKRKERFISKHKREPNIDEMKKLGIECGKENCCQKKE